MSLRPSERAEVRRNRYKVAVDAKEGRRRREDNMVEIRKSRREESLLKKRRDGRLLLVFLRIPEKSIVTFLNISLVLRFASSGSTRQVQEMEEKLNKLRSGVILVKPEDKKIIEESFSDKVNQWRKRKRMFKELWDNITENSPKDQKEFKVLVHFFFYSDMLTSLNKRRKVSR